MGLKKTELHPKLNSNSHNIFFNILLTILFYDFLFKNKNMTVFTFGFQGFLCSICLHLSVRIHLDTIEGHYIPVPMIELKLKGER